MTSPVVFTLTNAGINAAIDAEGPGLSITVSELAIGTGKHTPSATATALQAETHRFPLAGAGVNAASHTLQFTSVLEAASQTEAFEIGLFTDTGVLFAIASTTGTAPLVVLYAGIAFVASFGLSLTGIPAGTVTVSVDPTASVAASMLQQHLAASNPHPQYAGKSEYDAHVTQNALEHANLLTATMAVNSDLQAHKTASNPHAQYALLADVQPRHLFTFRHDCIPSAYAISSGNSSGGVTHTLEGAAQSFGSCLYKPGVIKVEYGYSYPVAGLPSGTNMGYTIFAKLGFFLKFEGFITFGSYAAQGDTTFADPTAKIILKDGATGEIVIEIPLTLSFRSMPFPNGGTIGQVTYRANADYWIYNLDNSNGGTPNDLQAVLHADGYSDSNGGSSDLQILTIEQFCIFCSY